MGGGGNVRQKTLEPRLHLPIDNVMEDEDGLRRRIGEYGLKIKRLLSFRVQSINKGKIHGPVQIFFNNGRHSLWRKAFDYPQVQFFFDGNFVSEGNSIYIGMLRNIQLHRGIQNDDLRLRIQKR